MTVKRAYTISALVHLNVDRVVHARDEDEAIALFEEACAISFGEDCTLADVYEVAPLNS